MQRIIFGTDNWSQGATAASLTAAVGRPASNLQRISPRLYWQSVGAGPHRLSFTRADARAASLIPLLFHNGSEEATWRIRFGVNAVSVEGGIHAYDSTNGFGACVTLDGIDARVWVGGSAALDVGTFTIEALIRPQTIRRMGIVQRDGGSVDAVLSMDEDGHIRFFSWPGTVVDLTSPSAIEAGVWTHVAAKYASGTATLYVNGVPVDSASASETFDGESLEIGSVESSARFWGEIDEVRFWNVGRSDAEILAAYAAPLDTVPASCVGYWKLDSQSGVVASDSSASSNAGDLEDGARFAYPDKLRTPWCSVDSDGVPIGTDRDPFAGAHHALWFNPFGVVARYCRIDILDPNNADGYLRVGCAPISAAWQSSMNPSYGGDMVGFTDASVVDILPNGSTSILRVPTREDMRFQIMGFNEREIWENTYELAAFLGTSRPCVIVFNAGETEFLQQQIVYARFKEPPRVVHFGWGSYAQSFAIEGVR